MTPRQFGPTMRIWPRRASARTCRSSSSPAAPVSLKPAEMMTAPGTPAWTQSRMIPGMLGGGVTTTTRSTLPGTARMLGIRLHAQDGVALGVDRVDRAGELALDEVLQHRSPDAVRRFRGANQGDRFGGKNTVQRPRAVADRRMSWASSTRWGFGGG